MSGLDDHMQTIYGWICQQPDPEAAVAALEDYALRDLSGWLARRGAVNGIPSLIHGLCLVQAAERFMKLTPPGNGGAL